MALNSSDYKKDVLLPWSRDPARKGALQSAVAGLQNDAGHTGYVGLDLATLFAIPQGPLTPAALSEHSTQLEMAFNKAKTMPSAAQLKKLKALLSDQGKFEDPAFWGGLGSSQAEAHRSALQAAVADLRAEAPVGMVSRGDAERRLAALGLTAVDPDALERAMSAGGVEIVDDLELPDPTRMKRIENVWRRAREHTEFRSVVDLMTLGRDDAPSDVRLIDGFSSAGISIGPDDVTAAYERSLSLKDTGAIQDAQKLLAELRHVTDARELRDIALLTVAARAEELSSQGLPQLRVAKTLRDAGIDDRDARRIVATISSRGSAAARPVGVDDVRARLSAGDLVGAKRTLEALEDQPETAAERTRLGQQIAQMEERKAAALAAYRQALASQDLATAESRLHEAIAVDRDDPALAEFLARLPLEAPTVTVRSVAGGVHVSWTESDPSARYSVFRVVNGVVGHVPTGAPIASDLTRTTYEDTGAPVGERLSYGVVAVRPGGGAPSSTGSAEVIHLPAPADCEVRAGEGYVDVVWSVPAQALAVSVDVVAPDGTTSRHDISGGSSHRVSGLQIGRQYRFVLTAQYLTDSGRVESPPVSLTGTPRGAARPVTDLEVDQTGAGGTDYTVRWTPVPGFVTEMWMLPRSAQTSVGQTVSVERLRALGGRPVAVTMTRHGDGRAVGAVRTPPEISVLVPALAVEAGYLLGSSVLIGRAPHVLDPVARAMSDQVRVTWDWPEGDYLVEVQWRTPSGVRSRRVTRARYRTEGAVYLSDARHVADISLSTVSRVGDEEWSSGRVPVEFHAPVTSTSLISYTISINRSLLGKSKVTVEVTSGAPAGRTELGLYRSDGPDMPMSPSGASLIAPLTPDFTDSLHHRFTFDVGRLKSPYWIKLFAPDPRTTTIVDPPISQLKG